SEERSSRSITTDVTPSSLYIGDRVTGRVRGFQSAFGSPASSTVRTGTGGQDRLHSRGCRGRRQRRRAPVRRRLRPQPPSRDSPPPGPVATPRPGRTRVGPSAATAADLTRPTAG